MKIEGRGKNQMSAIKIIFTVIYIALSGFGLIIFKLGVEKGFEVGFKNGNFIFNISLMSILGLLCYVGSFLIYIMIVSRTDISFIGPIATGAVYIVTFIGAATLLKEKITIAHYVGAVVILIGILIISLKK